MKNKIVIEWQSEPGAESDRLRNRLLGGTAEAIRITMEEDDAKPKALAIFIRSEHEELVNISSLTQSAYEYP